LDELFGSIADAIAKKLREANMTVAAAEQAQAEAQGRAMSRASGVAAPQPPSAREIARNVSRPNEPMGRMIPATKRVVAQPITPLDEIFPTALEPLHTTTPRHASVALLAAFSGGTPLLAAVVLSEALAPPIALRQRER
jgi:hypothetical protein